MSLEEQASFAERCGKVAYDDYAGYRTVHVVVIGETPKRYRCRFKNGAVRLVPKRSVRVLLPGECVEHGSVQRDEREGGAA